jgi:hypothetical protein
VIFEFASFTAAQWIVLITTIFTGVGTILAGLAAIKRAKGETRTEMEIDCLNRLKAARLEESLAQDELRELKRKYST